MNAVTSHPFVQFALRTAERAFIGALIGLALWAIGLPAFAQDSAPELPGRPAAQLILKSDSLRLIGRFGQEVFAIADDGTVELSGLATIDFSPSMQADTVGGAAGAIRVRVGGKLYTMQLFEDVPCQRRGCPQ